MKKIIIILSIFFLLIITNITAYSLDFPDVKDTKYEEAVQFLSAYGIANGFPDGTFKPNEPITRAEMSKLLTIAIGYKEYSENMVSIFTDMKDHWAEQYVEIMNVLDIVQGYLDYSFGPDNNITYSEAVTMIVRALGYTDRSLPGDWPYDYFVKAAELGIVEGVTLTSGNATRGDIALMLYHAINCKIVTVNDDYEIKESKKTLLDTMGTKETHTITLDFLEKTSKINIEDYLFETADVYYNLDDEIVFLNNIKTTHFTGKITSQLSKYKIFVKDENGNIKPYDIYKTPIYYNGTKGKVLSLLDANVTVVYNENSPEGSAKGIKAVEITDVLDVELENLYKNGDTKFLGKYLPLNDDDKPDIDNIIVTGAADSLQDIIEKDVLYFYETDEYKYNKSKITIEVIRNKALGIIKELTYLNGLQGYVINGKTYYLSPYFKQTENIKLGYEVEALLDKEGRIVRFYVTKYFNEPQIYGLVIGTQNGEKVEGMTIKTTLPQIKILDQYGKTKIYEIEENSNIISSIKNSFDTKLSVDLEKHDIIKFNIQENGRIKLIDKVETENISGAYNSSSGLMRSQNKMIINDTIIFYHDDTTYRLIKNEDLDEFITGTIDANYNDKIKVMYLKRGYKNTYSGNFYSIIKEVSKVLDYEENVVEKAIFYTADPLYATSKLDKSLENYKNKFVKLSMKDGRIANVEEVIAENEITDVQAVYSRLLKIDGTYYEISSDVFIYICSTDENNIINGVEKGYKEDINIGSRVQFYDTTGEYEGVIDVIIVYE